MSWATRTYSAGDVCDAKTFAGFVQQEIGTPYPTGRQIGQLQMKIREYFEANPKATWSTLATTALWVKAKGRHPAHAWLVLNDARFAWRDGWLPELTPKERAEDWVEDGLATALNVETDPEWRRLLLACNGRDARREALTTWRKANA